MLSEGQFALLAEHGEERRAEVGDVLFRVGDRRRRWGLALDSVRESRHAGAAETARGFDPVASTFRPTIGFPHDPVGNDPAQPSSTASSSDSAIRTVRARCPLAVVGFRALDVQPVEELPGCPFGPEHVRRRVPPVLRNGVELALEL